MEAIIHWLTNENGLLLLAGMVLGWLLAQYKMVSEIRKLDSEIIDLKINQSEKLHELDNRQRTIGLGLLQKLRTFNEAKKVKDVQNLKIARDTLYTVFFIDFIGSYYQFFNYGKLLLNKNELIDNEVFPFLEDAHNILTKLNHPDTLQLTKESPFPLKEYDLAFAFNFLRKNIRFWDRNRRQKFQQLKNQFQHFYNL